MSYKILYFVYYFFLLDNFPTGHFFKMADRMVLQGKTNIDKTVKFFTFR